jgi:hypothetical protein
MHLQECWALRYRFRQQTARTEERQERREFSDGGSGERKRVVYVGEPVYLESGCLCIDFLWRRDFAAYLKYTRNYPRLSV